MAGDSPASVLIIDSDNVRRGMLACTLPATQYRLNFASSAEKGLDLLAEVKPEVVIVGGGNDAVELCQRIRSLPSGARCTLVLMDERYRDESLGRSEAVSAGADTFLPFPFEGELFATRLKAKIPRQPTPAQLMAAPSQVGWPAAPEPAASEEAWRRFGDKVRDIHTRLDTLDYYQLLEVKKDASVNAIKKAYFARSMEYHPDRFVRLEDQELKGGIYQVFKRVSEAFKVLVNPEARSRYDDHLAAPSGEQNLRLLDREKPGTSPEDPSSDATTPAGKKYLHYAVLAQAEGKYRSARMFLTMALQYEPDNERLHARLDEVTRKLG